MMNAGMRTAFVIAALVVLLLLLAVSINADIVGAFKGKRRGKTTLAQMVSARAFTSLLRENVPVNQTVRLGWLDPASGRTSVSTLTRSGLDAWVLVTDVGWGSAGRVLPLTTPLLTLLVGGVPGVTSVTLKNVRYDTAGSGVIPTPPPPAVQ